MRGGGWRRLSGKGNSKHWPSFGGKVAPAAGALQEPQGENGNFALLVALYTLQGIPMGLSASIPLLLQQRFSSMRSLVAAAAEGDPALAQSASALAASVDQSRLYGAQALFALCSWPFSLKLLWAPLVDACFSKTIGRRKSWLLPAQFVAGCLLWGGSSFVDRQLVLPPNLSSLPPDSLLASLSALPFDIKGVTLFFFTLYLLLATQDIAVDGWALTMLSKENRGKGPVCNSIGQNIGTLLSYTGFLAMNDETVSRALRNFFGLSPRSSNGSMSLITLEGFLKGCGMAMCAVTVAVGLFKPESSSQPAPGPRAISSPGPVTRSKAKVIKAEALADEQMDAADIGIKETYLRLFNCCKLPTVRWLVFLLLTYRFPTSLSDNVKFLKALDYGLPKATVSMLAPAVILPLGILTPIIASKIWSGRPLKQFTFGYKLRLTVVAAFDVASLLAIKHSDQLGSLAVMATLVISTAAQTIMSSLQFNAQMTFFASRVDRNIGGSYMTLLNTFANLGGTWPASPILYLMGKVNMGKLDAYFPLQGVLSVGGLVYLFLMGSKIEWLENAKESDWSSDARRDKKNT